MIFENQDEAKAFNKVLKCRKVNTLIGVGAFGHVWHCFALGFPNTMVLIDPQWSHEETFGKEINRLEQFKDKDVPLKFIKTSSTVDTVEFYFDGQKKTVHFYKICYDPSILGRFQPDVFHMGHAVISDKLLPFELVLESMLLLPKGTIIMNTDGGVTQYKMSLLIYAHYFLSVAAVYREKDVWAGLVTCYIYKKTQDIDEKESVLVYKFARAFDEFCGCLEQRESMKGSESWEKEMLRQGKIMDEEERTARALRQHQKEIVGLPKTLKTVWAVFTIAQKKKLIKLIYDFAGNRKELAEEAIEIASLK